MPLTLIDPIGYPDKTSASNDAKAINYRLPRALCEAGTAELANAIACGRAWCPSLFTTTSRKSEYWQSINWLFADIDKASLNEQAILGIARKANLPRPSILHESYSSSSEARKWRVVYQLEEPIIALQDAYKALISIGELFGADMPVQEPARLLFGTRAGLLCRQSDTLLDAGHISKLLKMKTNKQSPTNFASKPIDESETEAFDLNELSRRERKIVLFAMQDVKELMTNPYAKREGYEGNSRYEALWASARKLGQLPCVPYPCIVNWLSKEIETNSLIWANWDKEPIDVIEQGAQWGRNHARI